MTITPFVRRVLLSLLLPVAVLVYFIGRPWVGAPCARKVVTVSISPDGIPDAWAALLYEHSCSAGMVTTYNYVVQLTKTKDIRSLSLAWRDLTNEVDDKKGDVLAIDASSILLRPKLQWLESRKIEILVENTSLIGLNVSSYSDVSIELKYQPDDPVARATQLEKMKLNVEQLLELNAKKKR